MKTLHLIVTMAAICHSGLAYAQDWTAPSGPTPSIVLPKRTVQPREPGPSVTPPPDGIPAIFEPAEPGPHPYDPVPDATHDRERTFPATPAPSPAAQQTGRRTYVSGQVISGVADVADGHSMVVGGHALRLDGVDAPGLEQTCSSPEGMAWRCGASARRVLAELVHGEDVRCVVTVPLGSGAAAICSARGIADIGREIVLRGQAVPNGHDRGRYDRESASARTARAGLWTGTFQAPWTWRKQHGGS